MLTIAVLLGAFAVAAGVGYTASRPLLGDGCAFLGKGHTVAHVCGETGKSDAEIAQQLATGKEEIQTVRLPDGRLAIVNQTTRTVSYFDSATLTLTAPPSSSPAAPDGKLEPVPTATDGYLVDPSRKVVEKIGLPAQPASAPVEIPDGIAAAVPSGDSLWVMTPKAEVVEVSDGRAVRTIRLGASAAGITVADSQPVIVAEDGNAYAVDGAQPKLLGNVGLTGRSLKFASWRGAGRYVVAVDPATARVGILDPRTGHQRTVQLKVTAGRAELEAPVMLGQRVYVPDRFGPSLWRIDLTKDTADEKPLEVPGLPGPFTVTVESGHVWANSQYDRRVLVIDADGHHHVGDKGPRPELGDKEAQNGQPGAPTGTAPPSETPEGQTTDGPPSGATAPMVAVPAFPSGTPYRQACEEIKRLKLVCRTVAGGDRPGLRTGDVVETDPAPGTMVPEGSRVVVRYAGPLKTPSVVGVWHADACRQIQAAKLTCAPAIDPNPALSPGQLGVVTTQTPDPQQPLAKGKAVNYTYPDSIALPSFLNQPWTEACRQVTDLYRMRCDAAPGNAPVPGQQVAGHVYTQNPGSPFVARMGATISLRYYRGSSRMPRSVGKLIDAACAEVEGQGFSCKRQEGATAWGTGHAINEVYQQSHTADVETPVGTQVTLVYYSGNQTLPNYVSANINTACADINRLGFQCVPQQALYRSTNVVEAQGRPAGRHPLGSQVTVFYSPWQPVDLWIVQYGAGWRIQRGSGTYRIGLAYELASPIPNPRIINEFDCQSPKPACRGHGVGIFYSRIGLNAPQVDPDYRPGRPFMNFITCTGAPGQRWVWRFWNVDANRRFTYGLVHTDSPSPPAVGSDREMLGCIWW